MAKQALIDISVKPPLGTPEFFRWRAAKAGQANWKKKHAAQAAAVAISAPPPRAEVKLAQAAKPAARPPRKFWSPAEIESIVTALVARLLKQGFPVLPSHDDRIGSAFVLNFIREAQSEVLPAERRRPIVSRQNINEAFWLRAQQVLKSRLAEKETAARLAAAENVPPPPPPPEPSKPALDDFTDEQIIAAAAVRLFRAFQNRGAGAAGADVAQLAKQVAEVTGLNAMLTEDVSTITDELRRLRTIAGTQLGDTGFKIPGVNGDAHGSNGNGNGAKPAAPLPRVAVLGCRADQFALIEAGVKRAGIAAKLRHYDPDTQPRSFLSDFAVTLRWTTHKWDAYAKAAVPDGHWMFTAGGCDTAVSIIVKWLAHGAYVPAS